MCHTIFVRAPVSFYQQKIKTFLSPINLYIYGDRDKQEDYLNVFAFIAKQQTNWYFNQNQFYNFALIYSVIHFIIRMIVARVCIFFVLQTAKEPLSWKNIGVCSFEMEFRKVKIEYLRLCFCALVKWNFVTKKKKL